MNTKLLRLARRHRCGVRTWIVPGFSNAARLTPSSFTHDGWGASFQWPCYDPHDGSEIQRGVDLNRHRSIARQAALALLIKAAQP
ncbi:hypothetical protein [Azospirillum sp. TSO5]|uniref:hypothetical protein n=1 Tax=Azospirillum sp. TSO5 TaxID=716760 RepID=UPI0011B237F8|nr:hypothetical protein [Azospirillum sp. TSO5]